MLAIFLFLADEGKDSFLREIWDLGDRGGEQMEEMDPGGEESLKQGGRNIRVYFGWWRW